MSARLKTAIDALRDLPFTDFMIIAEALRSELDSAGATLPGFNDMTTVVSAGALAGAIEKVHVKNGGE